MHRKTSSPLRTLATALARAALLGALFAGITAGAQTPAAIDTAAAFDNALVAYERNHWDSAYAAFTALADQGHPEAARLALQMWRHGPGLYRRRFLPAHTAGCWSRVWRCGAKGEPLRACQLALQQP
jgi:hypothetical protein